MFRSTNPATGEQIATYPELSPEELDTKLNQAVSAFHAWRLTRLETRTNLLSRIADAYTANKDRMARMATQEMGKTYASAVAEVEKCIAAFRHYAQHGPAMLAPVQQKLSSGTAEIRWLPPRAFTTFQLRRSNCTVSAPSLAMRMR